MPKDIKRKSSFGTAMVNHFSPGARGGWPKAIDVVLSFEEALKLHLSRGQILGHLSEYKRSTKDGRRTAADLCIQRGMKQSTISEGLLEVPEEKAVNG